MPVYAIAQAILKVAYYFGINMSVGFAMGAAYVVQFVAVTAASMGASRLLQKKLPSYSSIADRTQMVRSPISPRQIIYGQTKVSGTLLYISTTGTKNEFLHLIIGLAGHEVEEIGDVYFNDELALTGSGSAASGRFTGFAQIYKKLGSDTQTVETNLQAATSGLVNGAWTANHRLRGIAYLYVRLTWSEKVWVGGIPNVTAIVKGKKVYDPRTATTGYSANAALCLRDYLTDTRLGMGMDATEMDDTAFIAAANICDENVQIAPASPVVYEKRYEANGVLSTGATPDDNIGKLLSAMGGLISYSSGKIVPYAAGYRIPTVTLNESDLAGAVQVQTKVSARDRVNAVKGVFVSAKSEWQATDFPQVAPATYYTEDGNIRYFRDVVLPMTTSSSCAQRLARIDLRRARQEVTMTARFKLDAMQLRAGDTVMITNSKFGWTNKVFEVMDWTFVSEGEPPNLAINMTLRETASSVYDWSVTDEEPVANTPQTTLPNPFVLSPPTNLALTADGTTQLTQNDGTVLPRIKVSWSAPSAQFVQAGGETLLEYKPGNTVTYLTWSKMEGSRELDYISSDIKVGVSYDVRVSGISYFGVSTSYVTGSITVANGTTGPNAPTSVTYVAGNSAGYGRAPHMFAQIVSRQLRVNWTASTSPQVAYYEYALPSSDSTAAADAALKYRVDDLEVILAATIWATGYFYVRAVDNTGLRSVWAGGGVNTDTYAQIPSGNMINQNSSAVSSTGLTLGGGVSSRQVKTLYDTNEVISITGGTASVTVGLNIADRGFPAKPDSGIVVVEDTIYCGYYDFATAASTSATAVVVIYRNDGGTLGTGNLRLSARFVDYA